MNLQSNMLSLLAFHIDYACSEGRVEEAAALMTDIYETVRKHGGKVLAELDAPGKDFTGQAFASMALFYSAGDGDDNRYINRIAAENAFYCCAGAFCDYGLRNQLPALFSLVVKGHELLAPLYESAGCGEDSSLILSYYIFNCFYDVREKRMPDVPKYCRIHLPDDDAVSSYLREMSELEDFSHREYMGQGKDIFEKVYEETKRIMAYDWTV